MTKSMKEPNETPDASTLPIDMSVVTALIKGLAAAEQFSTRVKQDVPRMEEFDTDDWIGWRATANFAPVDYTTLTKDKREYYTPPPLSPGIEFKAPDNAFWRGFETQGMIERIRR